MRYTEKEPLVPAAKNSTAVFSHIHSIIEITVCILSLVIIIFTFFIRIGTVYGHSMQNTLSNGDIILFSPMIKNIEQGDIIVFEPSGGDFSKPLVKRVIAIEGQKVCVDSVTGIVSVDGKEIPENDYVSNQKDTFIESFTSPYTVEPGHVFVLGDNRGNSVDSRHAEVGAVDITNVIGKVILRIYPFANAGTVD